MEVPSPLTKTQANHVVHASSEGTRLNPVAPGGTPKAPSLVNMSPRSAHYNATGSASGSGHNNKRRHTHTRASTHSNSTRLKIDLPATLLNSPAVQDSAIKSLRRLSGSQTSLADHRIQLTSAKDKDSESESLVAESDGREDKRYLKANHSKLTRRTVRQEQRTSSQKAKSMERSESNMGSPVQHSFSSRDMKVDPQDLQDVEGAQSKKEGKMVHSWLVAAECFEVEEPIEFLDTLKLDLEDQLHSFVGKSSYYVGLKDDSTRCIVAVCNECTEREQNILNLGYGKNALFIDRYGSKKFWLPVDSFLKKSKSLKLFLSNKCASDNVSWHHVNLLEYTDFEIDLSQFSSTSHFQVSKIRVGCITPGRKMDSLHETLGPTSSFWKFLHKMQLSTEEYINLHPDSPSNIVSNFETTWSNIPVEFSVGLQDTTVPCYIIYFEHVLTRLEASALPKNGQIFAIIQHIQNSDQYHLYFIHRSQLAAFEPRTSSVKFNIWELREYLLVKLHNGLVKVLSNQKEICENRQRALDNLLPSFDSKRKKKQLFEKLATTPRRSPLFVREAERKALPTSSEFKVSCPPYKCTFSGIMSNNSIGSPGTIQLQVDCNGNPLTFGKIIFTVSEFEIPENSVGTKVSPIDTKEGRYELWYNVIVPGTYELRVEIEGIVVLNKKIVSWTEKKEESFVPSEVDLNYIFSWAKPEYMDIMKKHSIDIHTLANPNTLTLLRSIGIPAGVAVKYMEQAKRVTNCPGTVEDLCHWILNVLHLGKEVCDTFRREEIDVEVLSYLTENDLISFGIPIPSSSLILERYPFYFLSFSSKAKTRPDMRSLNVIDSPKSPHLEEKKLRRATRGETDAGSQRVSEEHQKEELEIHSPRKKDSKNPAKLLNRLSTGNPGGSRVSNPISPRKGHQSITEFTLKQLHKKAEVSKHAVLEVDKKVDSNESGDVISSYKQNTDPEIFTPRHTKVVKILPSWNENTETTNSQKFQINFQDIEDTMDNELVVSLRVGDTVKPDCWIKSTKFCIEQSHENCELPFLKIFRNYYTEEFISIEHFIFYGMSEGICRSIFIIAKEPKTNIRLLRNVHFQALYVSSNSSDLFEIPGYCLSHDTVDARDFLHFLNSATTGIIFNSVPQTLMTIFSEQFTSLESKLSYRIKSFTVGILYVQKNQKDLHESIFSNKPSNEFWNFMNTMGKQIDLAEWDGYRGNFGSGEKGTTYFKEWRKLDVMYHVAPMLNKEQKRRLNGNDVCHIIYFEDMTEDKIDVDLFQDLGSMAQVFAAVLRVEGGYKVGFFHSPSLSNYYPLSPSPNFVFKDTGNISFLCDFLLSKMHNGYAAAISTPPLSKFYTKPKAAALKDIGDGFVAKNKPKRKSSKPSNKSITKNT